MGSPREVDAMNDRIGTWGRSAVWALPVFGVLLVAGAIAQHAEYRPDVAAYANHVTTTTFLASDLIASFGDTAVGLVVMAGAAFATSVVVFVVGVFMEMQVPFLQPLTAIGLTVAGVAIARARAAAAPGSEGTVFADEEMVR
jgi:hypothetical protein